MNVWLRILTGGLAGATKMLSLPEGGTARIGRAEDNDIAFDPAVDVAVSSHHAQILASNGALYLYDLGSTNGTWVDGQQVTQVHVPSGTRVTFGRKGPEVEVIWQPDVAPTQAAPAPAAAASDHLNKTKPQAFQALPAMPSPEHAPEAYQQPAAPAPATDTCGMCGAVLFFVCFQCRRTLCASHYDPATGVCVQCSGAGAGAAPPTAAVPAPAAAYGYAPPPAYAPAAPAGEDDMALPPRRRRPPGPPPDDMALPPRRRTGPPPGDDELPPRRRSGPPPADDELPPRRRRPH
jgi:predicted component of type VI protein secretion system